MGEMMMDYDGFEEALLMAVEVDDSEYYEPVVNSDPIAHWAMQVCTFLAPTALCLPSVAHCMLWATAVHVQDARRQNRVATNMHRRTSRAPEGDVQMLHFLHHTVYTSPLVKNRESV